MSACVHWCPCPDWAGDWGHIFCADHKLWSKTSITCWVNAISIRQPYHLDKQWVPPRGNDRCLSLCVNNEVFTKRTVKKGEGEERLLWCSFWVIKEERWSVCYQWRVGRYLSWFSSVLLSLSEISIRWTFCSYEVFTLPEICQVFFHHTSKIKLVVAWITHL